MLRKIGLQIVATAIALGLALDPATAAGFSHTIRPSIAHFQMTLLNTEAFANRASTLPKFSWSSARTRIGSLWIRLNGQETREGIPVLLLMPSGGFMKPKWWKDGMQDLREWVPGFLIGIGLMVWGGAVMYMYEIVYRQWHWKQEYVMPPAMFLGAIPMTMGFLIFVLSGVAPKPFPIDPKWRSAWQQAKTRSLYVFNVTWRAIRTPLTLPNGKWNKSRLALVVLLGVNGGFVYGLIHPSQVFEKPGMGLATADIMLMFAIAVSVIVIASHPKSPSEPGAFRNLIGKRGDAPAIRRVEYAGIVLLAAGVLILGPLASVASESSKNAYLIMFTLCLPTVIFISIPGFMILAEEGWAWLKKQPLILALNQLIHQNVARFENSATITKVIIIAAVAMFIAVASFGAFLVWVLTSGELHMSGKLMGRGLGWLILSVPILGAVLNGHANRGTVLEDPNVSRFASAA